MALPIARACDRSQFFLAIIGLADQSVSAGAHRLQLLEAKDRRIAMPDRRDHLPTSGSSLIGFSGDVGRASRFEAEIGARCGERALEALCGALGSEEEDESAQS